MVYPRKARAAVASDSSGLSIPAACVAVSRRHFVLGPAACLAASLVSATSASAAEPLPERSSQFFIAYRALVGETEPPDGPIALDLPDLAENGNMVPFTMAVDSPMTEVAHVQTLTIFSTGNPQPVIATFHFSPLSGRARVSGRLRLARTQDLVVVAKLSTGSFIKATGRVDVTVGGCGAG